MLPFVRQALAKYNLLEAYKARPPYQRNDYLGWIHRAVREETKRKRLGIMIAELKKGSGYMGLKWLPPSSRKR